MWIRSWKTNDETQTHNRRVRVIYASEGTLNDLHNLAKDVVKWLKELPIQLWQYNDES